MYSVNPGFFNAAMDSRITLRFIQATALKGISSQRTQRKAFRIVNYATGVVNKVKLCVLCDSVVSCF